MNELTYKVLTRLYRGQGSFSRNKNHRAYEDPRVKRAASLYQHLRSLELDLLQHGSADTVVLDALEPDEAGRIRVRLAINALSCKRVSVISRAELELLLENDVLRALFSAKI